MLYTPSTNTRSKRGLFGLVTTSSQSGPHMRRIAFPVQTRTAPALAWRQIFLATKQNWLALTVGAANIPDPNAVAPAVAWAMTNEQYNGIFTAGLIDNGLQQMGHMGPCATGEAYFTMVQANRASMGLTPLPTPTTTVSQANPPTSPFLDTYGTKQVFSSQPQFQPAQPGPLNAVLQIAASDSSSSSASLAVTVTGAPSDVTVTWSGSGTTSTTLTQTTFNATPQVLQVTIAPNRTAGALSLSLEFTAGGGPQSIPLNFTVTATGVQLTDVPATFSFPNAAACSTGYDNTMTVTGFYLTYTWEGLSLFPCTKYGTGWPGVYQILASDAYTDSYSPPDPGSWVPILFSGPWLPTPAELLAAWVSQYGDLPDSGNIKFQLLYIDTDSGAAGPALSATAGWKNGTLRGFARSAWSGPIYAFHLPPGPNAISAPGIATIPFSLAGSNGYGGTITPSLKGELIIPDGNNNVKKTLPTGITAVFDPPALTIPDGSTTPVSCTLTVTAASGAQAYSTFLDLGGGPDGQTARISCTDAISSLSASFVLELDGDVIHPPPANWLSINNPWQNPYSPSPGTVVMPIALYNTSSDPIGAIMLADASDATLTLTFDNINPTVPAATLANPGSVWVNLTIVIPADTNTSGTQVTIQAQAGHNTCDAGAYLGGTMYPGLSITTSTDELIIGSPGSGTATVTVYNQTESALTVAMTAPGGLPGCTATFSSPSLTLPAAAGGAPSSATTTLAVTTPSGLGLFAYQLRVTASVGAANAYCIVGVQ